MMDIEKGIAPNEHQYVSFVAMYGEKYTLVACDKLLRCAMRAKDNIDGHVPFTHFTRDQVKAALPYLQAFAESGTFEPLQKDGPDMRSALLEVSEAGTAMAANIVDQGQRIEALEHLLEKTSKEKAYYMRACDKQVDEIADLEELLEEWKKYGQASCNAKTSDMLLAETDQLLGESDD